MKRVGVGCLVVALASVAALPAFADCNADPSGRVVLQSDEVDPEVFLWDSRTRLTDYAAGAWGSTRSIFAHTMLAEPGTVAVVVACSPDALRTKNAARPLDAIGVRVMSGPYRGRYGWVLSSDIHVPRPTGESAVLGNPKE